MTDFKSQSIEFAGGFSIQAEVEEVFELFSPLGEREWIPDWDPELLYPPRQPWTLGQIFRTREEKGEAVWIVTTLDRQAHQVAYHRVEPGRYVACVCVTCTETREHGTAVSTTYSFVGVSDEGNREIETMTTDAYAEKMKRWQRWMAALFACT